jgi:lysophospholipase L1-like esterase
VRRQQFRRAAASPGTSRGPVSRRLISRRLISRRLAPAVIAAVAFVAGTAITAACTTSGPAARTTAQRSIGTRPAPLRPGPSYYLSLGDSLAAGVQPDADGASRPTDRGYADQLYAVLHRSAPGLRLVKLGCSGETSWTMIRGGICPYPGGSQLADARQFLRAHRGHVALITIDIGANDPNSCYLHARLSRLPSCMAARLRLTVTDLSMILSGLRAAGGPAVQLAGMNYYVPELAQWRDGRRTGQELAVLIERLVSGYNILLSREYAAYGARTADVFAAFHSADFAGRVSQPGGRTLPRSVAAICRLTWACAAAPRGPNEHPNDLGYALIAAAFRLVVQPQ